ncbi:5'-3' exoribonuclease 2 [Fistulifera solaris]|uniref:5'-3' exoribonuclease n=1 Tax=Fistulifera solaris TaxID=1519565 RepID=A0A1Z5JRL2_FISSO|nr:5'-3' exoribonuclease 2 [Fistulifera solaris]|eukprot:GAX16536.1 5'-3' exoribonuclease 2 [Fistulifera solaris]
MGVPAFYRWLSEKYPKIVQDILEERVPNQPNSSVPLLPLNIQGPNPNGIECDNLYIDMNGIIHPCSHPENGPQPTTEEEMFENVCHYVDRLVRAIRPRKLLYLAIDGVAPRAKMNQQRARRFRSAQEARELHELEEHVREELVKSGQFVPPHKKTWDSNVITPGTTFMLHLAEFLRFYIRKRLSTDKNWKDLRVIFSDASLPGEGEHKIMSHIRLQRAQAGYNPNTVHMLHGLDADLIMLALATHEAHFYITRELVLFGRKSQEQHEQRQMESGFLDAQKALDEKVGPEAMAMEINQQKPLQRISIPILREYLAAEFAVVLRPQALPFAASLERIIDDFVFLCFFVGNDFLPHLPSLDIRDGALDYLLNVYKRLLPSMGGYITNSGGNVNLSNVDIILAEVGAIEDFVFGMKHENEKREEERRREQSMRKKNNLRNDAPPEVAPVEHHRVKGRAARIMERQNKDKDIALSRGHQAKEDARHVQKAKRMMEQDNAKAAEDLKASLLGLVTEKSDKIEIGFVEASPKHEQDDDIVKNEEVQDQSLMNEEAIASPGTKRSLEEVEIGSEDEPPAAKMEREPGVVGDMEDEFDADDADEEEDLDIEKPKIEDLIEDTDPEITSRFKAKVKEEQQKKLDEHAKNVVDNVRLHEAGWKDRYYSDKCKADDIESNGGREHLFRSYVMGLCWVMKYYYDGCPSWKWYYPYHYGPFASDLKNIERFEKDCRAFELSTPFNPVEQLMAVLPSDSKHAIPKAARWLMEDPESPIIDFYPKEILVDPNGKAMPWLWVVLLPFIDEDRLLAALSPTMQHWTKQELFANARGLDDGYLFVHRSHPLSQKLATILKDGNTAKAGKTRLTDTAMYGCAGFCGSVRPPLSNELYPVEEDVTIGPPSSASKIVRSSDDNIFSEPLEPNDAVCVSFSEPPKLSHKSIILPGSKLLNPVLTDEDKRIRRPRLNRFGGTIANMGVGNGQSYQSGYGSMNVGSYERQLAEQTGRGHQMHQAGTRAWGAMEPAPKRSRGVPPPPPPPQPQYQIPNPFMRNPSVPSWQQSAQNSYHQYGHQNQNRPYGGYYGYHQQQIPQHGAQRGIQQRGTQPQYDQPPGYPGSRNHYPQQQRPPNYVQQQHQPPGRPGFDFRSFNNGQREPPRPGFQPRPAGSDVMSSLRAQLANTLRQNNNNRQGDPRR